MALRLAALLRRGPRLERRAAAREDPRARGPRPRSRRGAGRGLARGAREARPDGGCLADSGEQRRLLGPRAVDRGPRDCFPCPAGAVRCRPRPRGRALPRRRLAPGCLRGPVAQAAHRVPARRARAGGRTRDAARADPRIRRRGRPGACGAESGCGPRRRGPAARPRGARRRARARRGADPALGVHDRVRPPGTRPYRTAVAAQRCFTIEADRPARGRIARPSRRSA